jgi:hypothetical protein
LKRHQPPPCHAHRVRAPQRPHPRQLPNPEGCAERTVNIWKTEQKPAKNGGKVFLKVTWQSQERGYVDANCFDSSLFPWLINQTGKPTLLYLLKAGKYLNIVGVRA